MLLSNKVRNLLQQNMNNQNFSLLPHGGPEDDRERRDISFDRYNRYDTCIGMDQIITGFFKWSERYISNCSGQKNKFHQKNRMAKWRDILSKGTGLKLAFK